MLIVSVLSLVWTGASMQSVVRLGVTVPSVVMASVILLGVVAPFFGLRYLDIGTDNKTEEPTHRP